MKKQAYIAPECLLIALKTGGSLLNTASNEGYGVTQINPFSTRRNSFYDPSFLDVYDDFDEE